MARTLVLGSYAGQREPDVEDLDDERTDEAADHGPRPPNRLVPPMTTAVMTRRLASVRCSGRRRRPGR